MAEPTEGPSGPSGASDAQPPTDIEAAMNVLDEMSNFVGVLTGMVNQVMAVGFTREQATEMVSGLVTQSIQEQQRKLR